MLVSLKELFSSSNGLFIYVRYELYIHEIMPLEAFLFHLKKNKKKEMMKMKKREKINIKKTKRKERKKTMNKGKFNSFPLVVGSTLLWG